MIEFECGCEKPGWCPKLKRDMRGRLWELCHGCPPEDQCSDSDRLNYISRWLGVPTGQVRLVGSNSSMGAPWTRWQQAQSLALGFLRFVSNGCRFSSAELVRHRQSVCGVCPRWKNGNCSICGCSGIKWDFPTEQCPDDPPRWGRADIEPQIKSWAVGVTTAGHRGTLARTLSDLKAAGWPDVVVFAEPDSDAPKTALRSERRLGAWPNRFRAVKWLLENSDAEATLVCEDDILVAPGTRHWVESVGWPTQRCGVLSLYRHAGQVVDSGKPTERWRPVEEVCDPADPRGYTRAAGNVWGSCALAWPRWAAELMIADPIINAEFPDKPDRFSDVRVRHWLSRAGLEYWLAVPSRVQHRIDVPSILGHGGGADMRSNDYVGQETSDAANELWPM